MISWKAMIKELKTLTNPYDDFDDPDDEYMPGESPYNCPECKEPVEDITLPRCPHCDGSLRNLFVPKLTFFQFKKNTLSDITYYPAVEDKRRAAGVGMRSVWFAVLICAAYIMYILYLVHHTTYYQYFRFLSISDELGYVMIGLIALPLWWIICKLRKRRRFDTDAAVWEAVREEYYRLVMDMNDRYASVFEKALIKKYEPASEIFRVLVTGEEIGDGYKSIFIGANGRLIMTEVWDAADRGFEVFEVPIENIVSFSIKKRTIVDLGRESGVFIAAEEILKKAAVLEYRNETGETVRIFLSRRTGFKALCRLIPDKRLQ